MQTRLRQRGITMWGLLAVGAIIVFFTLMFFKLLPAYIENVTVKTALENVAKQPGVGNMDKAQISAALERRFDIDDVKRVDLKKHLFVDRKPGATVIRVAYEVREPLFFNIIALLVFDDSVQVSAR